MRLKDKVAIITGSGRGLGKVYAERFVQEGAKVTVCDVIDCRETAQAIEAIGGEVLSLRTDVTSEEDTVEMARKWRENRIAELQPRIAKNPLDIQAHRALRKLGVESNKQEG